MQHKHIPVDEFNLEKDLTKLNFSQHIAATTGSGDSKDEDNKLRDNKQPQSEAKTLFYGGKQAALESAGDELIENSLL